MGTAKFCVVCGAQLTQRPPEELERDLSHVRWLFGQIPRWEPSAVAGPARRYLVDRYTQQEKILLSALGHPAPAATGPTAAPPAPGTVALAPASSPTPARVPAPSAPPAPVRRPTPPSPKSFPAAQPAAAKTAPNGAASAGARAAGDTSPREPRVPRAVEEPLLGKPPPPSSAQRVVEATSSWSRVWRPFLYESIGWFVGAFLILAGTFYFVAESWSGMSSSSRSLVVFALTGAWSVGFALWGAFLSRRSTTESAGRVLSLIGAIISPLAVLALERVGWPWGLPLLAVWSAVVMALARAPARAFDPASAHWVAWGAAGATAWLGLAPFAARLGHPALWFDLALALYVALTLRTRPAGRKRSSAQLAFVALAPLYLAALAAVRLHLALAQHDALPPWGTYAPFVALLAAAVLSLREDDVTKAADPWGIGVVAAQLVLCLVAGAGEAPAFFVTSVVAALSAYRLSRGGPPARVRWGYATYAFSYLAYQSCYQLVPDALRPILAAIKSFLGYQPSHALPASYDAVYAALFVAAVALLGLLRRGPTDERGRGRADVLAHSTAAASALFALAAVSHWQDLRPALWSLPVFATLNVLLGSALRRRALAFVGSALAVLWGVVMVAAWGPSGGALGASLVCLALAPVAVLELRPLRQAYSLAVAGLATLVLLAAWTGAAQPAQVVALFLSGLAALVVARNLDEPWAVASALGVNLLVVPRALLWLHPDFAPLSLALAALGLAFLPTSARRWQGVPTVVALASAGAVAWQWTAQVSGGPVLLGPVLLAAAAATYLAAREQSLLRPVATVWLACSLLPWVAPYGPWPWMTPLLSASGFAAASLAASLRVHFCESSRSARLLAALSLAGAALAAVVSEGRWEVLALASLAALLCTRALLAAVTVPLAALAALAALAQVPHLPLQPAWFALAAGLTALSLLDEAPALRRLLAGDWRVALPASLSALGVALAMVLASWFHRGGTEPWTLALALLPLVWGRTTRQPLFLALCLVLSALLSAGPHDARLWLAGAAAVVVLTRALAHAALVRRVWLSDRANLGWHLSALWWVFVGCTAALVALHPRDETVLWAAALALLLGAGGPLGLRAVSGAACVALSPSLAVPGMALLLLLSLAVRRRGELVHRALGLPAAAGSQAVLAWSALGLSVVHVLLRGPVDPHALLALCAVAVAVAVLTGQVALLAGAVAVAAVPPFVKPWLAPWLSHPQQVGLVVLLAAAALASLLRAERVNGLWARAARWAGPGLDSGTASALWAGGAASAAGLLAVRAVGEAVPTWPLVALLALLLWTPLRLEAALALALAGTGLAVLLPFGWVAAAVCALGLAAAVVGAFVRYEHPVGAVWLHAGWVLSLAGLLFVRSLHSTGTPVAFALAAAAAWVVAYRLRSLEPAGWLATVVAGHVLVLHLGIVFSTGRPPEAVLPYLAAVSATLALVAMALGGPPARRAVAFIVASVALVELLGAAALLDAPLAKEAGLASAVAVALLVGFTVRAARARDEVAAYCAQACLLVLYLCVRLLAQGAHSLGGPDTLAALVAGVALTGLYVWARQIEVPELSRATLVGAYALPALGLLVAPWDNPDQVALLLGGYAAHFAALAALKGARRASALLSAVSFNAALALAWLSTHAGELQYWLMPGALSVLVLVRVFRAELGPTAQARLRGVAVALLYAAAAWRPLTFGPPWAMWVCAAVCVVGVAVGIALRIRSYVYLGTAFLVTTVVANLVHFGVRDPRLGAAFLSALGLLVVAFMVLFTTRKSELLARYARVRLMLDQWER